jgi:hypothetical protein
MGRKRLHHQQVWLLRICRWSLWRHQVAIGASFLLVVARVAFSLMLVHLQQQVLLLRGTKPAVSFCQQKYACLVQPVVKWMPDNADANGSGTQQYFQSTGQHLFIRPCMETC